MDDLIELIDARKTSLSERVPDVTRRIQEDFAPREAALVARLDRVLADNASRRNKIVKIQALVSEVREAAAAHAACRQGCSACCHQRVMMSQTEADAIGHRIGRTAVQLRSDYVPPALHDFGPATPCPFLVQDACSIYEHRPFVCRNYLSLDTDALLCGFENLALAKAGDPRHTPVPHLDPGPLLAAYRQVSGKDRTGDIRAFFPPAAPA
ncbi:YkgJ family cysteine cluster protein [Noviherbaspirillum aridicola]|uniref:Zinc-or iron-chelating protein n=1 Tax=Noviherbaspirillum aridicola TaxID=2849687 RepID=A0ABQ4PZB0_9BURK|nr:YkgJ family cysteine cluster protein [Noviherbaspirillum aridicola]GIZ50092.1 hypothetical protein NCCP691_01060 [Noviherbaspirillum aridicola]